jgi:HK97 family phage prohead protease
MTDCVPQDDEDFEDFMERCTIDEDEDACREIWQEHRSGKPDVLRKTTTKPTGDPLNFILSDGSVDSYGDVIEPSGWDLTQFKRNPIAFFNHNPNFVIGKWRNVRVEKDALRGRLELASAGSSERIDEIRALVEQGILKAVSVGFVAKQHEPVDKDSKFAGRRFTKQALVECSLVSIPANSNALQEARRMNISRATQELVFGKAAVKKADAKPKVPSKAERDAISARLKRDIARTNLEMRIRKESDWLRTLETINERLCAQPTPVWDGVDWSARPAIEKKIAEQTERTVQRLIAIDKQSEYVRQLKRSYRRIYAKEYGG